MCIQKHHKMQYPAVSFDRCKTWSYPCFNTSHNEERSILLKMNASQHGTERKIATVTLQANIRRNLRPSAITRKRLRKSDAQVLSPERDTRLCINPRKRHLKLRVINWETSEVKYCNPQKRHEFRDQVFSSQKRHFKDVYVSPETFQARIHVFSIRIRRLRSEVTYHHPRETMSVSYFPSFQQRTNSRETDNGANVSIKEELKHQSTGSRAPCWNP